MSPTLSEKCQFHVIPMAGCHGHTVSTSSSISGGGDLASGSREEVEDMDINSSDTQQLSLTINLHVGECVYIICTCTYTV